MILTWNPFLNVYSSCNYIYPYSIPINVLRINLQENDKIFLKRSVNEEWLEGEINGKTGIFPMCFVRVVVPLPNKDDTGYRESTMITLFDYHAQSWDDLELKVMVIYAAIN